MSLDYRRSDAPAAVDSVAKGTYVAVMLLGTRIVSCHDSRARRLQSVE